MQHAQEAGHHVLHHWLLAAAALDLNLAEQVAAISKLLHKVHIARVCPCCVQLDDVVMVQVDLDVDLSLHLGPAAHSRLSILKGVGITAPFSTMLAFCCWGEGAFANCLLYVPVEGGQLRLSVQLERHPLARLCIYGIKQLAAAALVQLCCQQELSDVPVHGAEHRRLKLHGVCPRRM